MIREDYVSFETAKLLKEKGFDVNTPCKYVGKEGATEEWYDDYRERMLTFNWDEGHLIEPLTEPQSQYGVYGDTIPAPTLQMVMKWLREVYKLHISVEMGFDVDYSQYFFYVPSVCRFSNKSGEYQTPFGEKEFDTYEEAAEAAIKYCLENLV